MIDVRLDEFEVRYFIDLIKNDEKPHNQEDRIKIELLLFDLIEVILPRFSRGEKRR